MKVKLRIIYERELEDSYYPQSKDSIVSRLVNELANMSCKDLVKLARVEEAKTTWVEIT